MYVLFPLCFTLVLRKKKRPTFITLRTKWRVFTGLATGDVIMSQALVNIMYVMEQNVSNSAKTNFW